MRFEGKTAIVTAAGAGIGRATVDILVAEGATVVAVEIDNSRLEKMAADLAGQAGTVIGCCIDARNEARVEALIAETEAAHGGVDILVNAVGGSTIVDNPQATVEELTFQEWQALIDFNLSATFLFCHAAVPGMKRAGSGKIINLSSIAGRGISAKSSSAYAAAKGRHHRLHAQAVDRAGAVRDQCERDCAQPDPDRTPAAALGETQRRGPGGGDRKSTLEADPQGNRPGPRDRVPGIPGRRLRYRIDH